MFCVAPGLAATTHPTGVLGAVSSPAVEASGAAPLVYLTTYTLRISTNRVKSAEVPTNVKEVVARFEEPRRWKTTPTPRRPTRRAPRCTRGWTRPTTTSHGRCGRWWRRCTVRGTRGGRGIRRGLAPEGTAPAAAVPSQSLCRRSGNSRGRSRSRYTDIPPADRPLASYHCP